MAGKQSPGIELIPGERRPHYGGSILTLIGHIALKVIFQGLKGQILHFLHLEVICSKTVQ